MSVVIISDIIKFGPAPRNQKLLTQLIKDSNIGLFVNLREKTKTSHWYEDELDNETQKILSIPTKSSNELMEEDSVFSAAKKICNTWKKKQLTHKSIYIHNQNGLKTEAILAFCVYGLMGGEKRIEDPVKWLRENGHYEVCIERASQEQLLVLWNRARDLSKWKQWNFKKSKKNINK